MIINAITRTRFIAALVCFLAIASGLPAFAEEDEADVPLTSVQREALFDEATGAYDAGDFAKAFDIWLPLARKNDLAAQRNVGHLLQQGLGVEKDPARALYWYERAGDAGLVSAQANAGIMHLTGEGVPRDLDQAAVYLIRAAQGGHTVAQYNAAVMFDRGIGVKRDPVKAMALYYLAARKNHEKASERLAELVIAPGALIDETDYVAQAQKQIEQEEDEARASGKTGFIVLDILSSVYRAAGAKPQSTETNGELNRIDLRSDR